MAKPLVSDELWTLIRPHIPLRPRRKRNPGRKPVPDRACLTGILFVLRTGIPWEMLPQEMGCGCGMTCWRRLRDWQEAGVWETVRRILLDKLRAADQLDFARAVVDSGSIRAVGGANGRGPALSTAENPARSTIC
jgi:transposase